MLREELADALGDRRLLSFERGEPRIALLIRERECFVEIWIDLAPSICGRHKRLYGHRRRAGAKGRSLPVFLRKSPYINSSTNSTHLNSSNWARFSCRR